MKNWIYFISTSVYLIPATASFMDGQGLYNLGNGDTTPSEVTRTAEPEVVPQPEQQMATASAPAAESTPEKPAETPKKDYTVKSAGSKAHGEKLVNIKSCGSIQFILGMKGANQNNCDVLKTAESFAPVLMNQLPICIKEGAVAKGFNKPIKKTKVFHAGSERTRKPPKGDLSLHYKARAIDIWNIDVFFEDGTSLKTPMNINSKKDPFYIKFNACWERLTKARMKKINSQCQRFDGVIDCSDKNHRYHVHLSMPYCPKKTGYKSY